MLKKATFTVYAIVILVMAMATFIEKAQGSAYVFSNIYGAWWFTVLWAMLGILGVIYLLHQRLKQISVVLLHTAFIVILVGALLTHLTAWQGMVHLRKGKPANTCMTEDGDTHSIRTLPFTITLDHFTILYHNGTEAAADYESHFTIATAEGKRQGFVSMNNIYSAEGIRLYQNGYDEDMEGTILSLNSDPWGIPVTYTGYSLLFLSMLFVLIDPKGRFRQLLRKAGMVTVLLLFVPTHTQALTTLSKQQAEEFGHLCINYGNRICPVQTFALDFTRKLYGKSSYQGYTAEQVLCGFIFYRDEWVHEPIVRIKSNEVRKNLGLPEYTSISSLFNEEGYRLDMYIQQYYAGEHNKLHEEVMKVDDKAMLAIQVSRGNMLKLFPYKGHWYAPNDSVPDDIKADHKAYFQHALPLLATLVQEEKVGEANEMLHKMAKYQQTFGANDLPSPTRLQAEHLYNSIPFAQILFMVCLTFALLSLFNWPWAKHLSLAALIFSSLALTLCLALRWIISGYIPMSNGYETMILMAWIIIQASLFVYHKFPIILTFGLMLSGFLLLVCHLGQMDPKITHLMPVLSSPLLSIHVSCVMMAYGLLCITFACGSYALIVCRKANKTHLISQLSLLSQLFLYPALFLLTAGIFIGAIWANVSWGRYWGWDPKEVWALITMLIYALALHNTSIPWLRKPQHYHLYMVLAFLTVLITYFGVNFFMGGMHSYT